LATDSEHCADTSAADRSDSGNISVRPHNLSNMVSSSCERINKSWSIISKNKEKSLKCTPPDQNGNSGHTEKANSSRAESFY